MDIFLTLMLGSVLDFSHLTDKVRFTVIVGSMFLSAVYVLIRTWEKAKINGWDFSMPNITANKGDLSVKISDSDKDKDNDKDERK